MNTKLRSSSTRQQRQRSLGSLLLLWVMSTVLIGLSGISYLSYIVLADSAKSEILSQLNGQSTLVIQELAHTKTYTVALSEAVQAMKQSDVAEAESYRKLVFRFFRERPELAMSVYFGQAPFQIVPDRQGFLPYFYPDQNDADTPGELLPLPHENIRYSELFKNDNYPERAYYKVPVEAGKAVWMEPFDWHGITMTSLVMPFYKGDGSLLGIAGTDVNVTAVTELTNRPVVNESGYFALITGDGHLLGYPPDPALAKARQKATDVPELRQVWEKIGSQKTGLIQWNRTYWAYQRIASTDWVMLAVVSKWAVIGRVLSITLGGAAAVGSLLTVVVVGFVRYLNSRLQPLVQECQRLIESDAQRMLRLQIEIGASDCCADQLPLTTILKGDELDMLSQSFSQMSQQLQQSFTALEDSNQDFNAALEQVKASQVQLIQSEKMSALGELVAGVAHEINNPVTFIHGNIAHVDTYTRDLLEIVKSYQTCYPQPPEEIKALLDDMDFDFLHKDLAKLLRSIEMGTQRIRQIVLSLRNFSRMDEAEFKAVDIHEGLDSSLLMLQHRMTGRSGCSAIEVVKDYGQLPLIDCYAGQLNQVFVNLLSNAIDALEDRVRLPALEDKPSTPDTIWISTCVIADEKVQITIADNGHGIPEAVQPRIFNPFFTTKSVGKGSGLGLSISYQIITEKHRGQIWCDGAIAAGTKLVIEIPIYQPKSNSAHDSQT